MCFGPGVNETARAIEDEEFLRPIRNFLNCPCLLIAHLAITLGNSLMIAYIYRRIFSRRRWPKRHNVRNIQRPDRRAPSPWPQDGNSINPRSCPQQLDTTSWWVSTIRGGEDKIFNEPSVGPDHVIFEHENLRFLKCLATERPNLRGGHTHSPAPTKIRPSASIWGRLRRATSKVSNMCRTWQHVIRRNGSNI